MADSPLQLHLLLKGRPIKDFTFIQELVRIGRDPEAEVTIDNPGISRRQARILRRPEGWVLEDCQSANGTWLNGRRIQSETLTDRDEITIGKFTLQVGLATRSVVPFPGGGRPRSEGPAIDQTTVLTQGQLAGILELARQAEASGRADPLYVPAQETMAAAAPWRRRLALGIMLVVAMIAGAVLATLLHR